jgi:hypothetical protein
MVTVNNAGIIVYRESKLPNILSGLSSLRLDGSIAIDEDAGQLNIYIIDCPVSNNRLDKKRQRQLRELIEEKRIRFLVERFEADIKSNVSQKQNELHYSQLMAEIGAIKQLAVLIKLSCDRDESLLRESLGFIMKSIDIYKLDLLSEEASSIMVYESPNMDEKQKKKLHYEFMEKKGVSLIFTKNIDRIIADSRVISIDGEVDLQEYSEELQDRIVLGRANDNAIRSIDKVILWGEELDITDTSSFPIAYNDEILAVMRYYNLNLDIIDFIKKLPYIYFDF